MTDLNKRRTLTTLGAAAVVTAVPTLATAMNTTTVESDLSSIVGHINADMATRGIKVDVTPYSGEASMEVRVTNLNSNSVALDHVGPSLIRSDNELYDLNTQLTRHGALTLDARETRAFVIAAI